MDALKNEASRRLADLSLPVLPPFFIFFFFSWNTCRPSSSDVGKSALHPLVVHTSKHNVYVGEKKQLFP